MLFDNSEGIAGNDRDNGETEGLEPSRDKVLLPAAISDGGLLTTRVDSAACSAP